MAAIWHQARGAVREPDGGAGAHELLLGLLVLLSLQAAPPETVGSVGDVSHYERDALKCLS